MKKDFLSEFEHQSILMQWANLQSRQFPDLQWLFAIPNGGYVLSKAAAGKLKAAGLKSGYPDLALDVARGTYYGLRIEMKRTQRSRVEPHQHEWHLRLIEQGYKVVVCFGWEEARDTLVTYLSLPPFPAHSP
jgi:VRR-NUC domain